MTNKEEAISHAQTFPQDEPTQPTLRKLYIASTFHTIIPSPKYIVTQHKANKIYKETFWSMKVTL